jgi:Cu-Zn family superoxide dismutase
MKTTWTIAVALPALLLTLPAHADHTNVLIHKIDAKGLGAGIGTIEFMDTPNGLAIMTDLKELSAGPHGFHVHENPSCEAKDKDGKPVAGLAAGGHYDPAGTKIHAGPQGNGHLGDLPPLTVAADGTNMETLTAPHLKVSDLKGHSIMIHEAGDNFSDQPKPLGGGGARVACGVVK